MARLRVLGIRTRAICVGKIDDINSKTVKELNISFVVLNALAGYPTVALLIDNQPFIDKMTANTNPGEIYSFWN